MVMKFLPNVGWIYDQEEALWTKNGKCHFSKQDIMVIKPAATTAALKSAHRGEFRMEKNRIQP